MLKSVERFVGDMSGLVQAELPDLEINLGDGSHGVSVDTSLAMYGVRRLLAHHEYASEVQMPNGAPRRFMEAMLRGYGDYIDEANRLRVGPSELLLAVPHEEEMRLMNTVLADTWYEDYFLPRTVPVDRQSDLGRTVRQASGELLLAPLYGRSAVSVVPIDGAVVARVLPGVSDRNTIQDTIVA